MIIPHSVIYCSTIRHFATHVTDADFPFSPFYLWLAISCSLKTMAIEFINNILFYTLWHIP
jgi:hypothetical protein